MLILISSLCGRIINTNRMMQVTRRIILSSVMKIEDMEDRTIYTQITDK